MIEAAPIAQAIIPVARTEVDMAALRKRLLVQIFFLLLVTCGAVVTGIALDEQKQNFMPEGHTLASVFNRKPSGTSGAEEIAQKAGLICKEWVLPYRQLSLIKGTLIIIAPTDALAEFEAKQVLDWVKEGNHLVFVDHFDYKFTRRLLKEIKVDAKEGASLVNVSVKTNSGSPEFAHVPDLTLTADMRLTGAPPLVSDKSGILFAKLKYGRGQILIGTAPSFISNRRLSTESSWPNFQFFVNYLNTKKGEAWFDERCHGFSNNANVFVFLMRGASGAVVCQIFFALAIAVIGASQRFGRTATLSDKRRKISNLEFIYGLANAYKRAKANTAALEIIGQAFRTKLCKALGISPHETTERVREVWKSSLLAADALKQPVDQFLSEYEAALARRTLSDTETKELIVLCDKITEQLKSVVLTQSTVTHERTTDDDKNS